MKQSVENLRQLVQHPVPLTFLRPAAPKIGLVFTIKLSLWWLVV